MHTPDTPASFGLATAPQQVDYASIQRIWLEADQLPEIDHLWAFDHLLPIAGDPTGPILEGWTLLSALAAQTQRARIGLMVSSNRFRPPAVLAKMATTVDIVSDGRLDFGLGVGSRAFPDVPREYLAHDLAFIPFREAVDSLSEACTVIRRLWTSEKPFDFDGRYVHLTGAVGNPKPAQHPHPPIVLAGRAAATLRVVAEHADIWNIPGGDLPDCIERSALLDRYCTEIGRDPAEIVRSIVLRFSYEDPEATQRAVADAHAAGFRHFVLGGPSPWPDGVARWVAEEIITPVRQSLA